MGYAVNSTSMERVPETTAPVIPIRRGREIKIEKAERAVEEVGQLVERIQTITREMAGAFEAVEALIQKEFRREGGPRGEVLASLDQEYVGWVERLQCVSRMLATGQTYQGVQSSRLTGEREYVRNQTILEDAQRALDRMNKEYGSKE